MSSTALWCRAKGHTLRARHSRNTAFFHFFTCFFLFFLSPFFPFFHPSFSPFFFSFRGRLKRKLLNISHDGAPGNTAQSKSQLGKPCGLGCVCKARTTRTLFKPNTVGSNLQREPHTKTEWLSRRLVNADRSTTVLGFVVSLLFSSHTCRCGCLFDCRGHHRARVFALERAVAQVCRVFRGRESNRRTEVGDCRGRVASLTEPNLPQTPRWCLTSSGMEVHGGGCPTSTVLLWKRHEEERTYPEFAGDRGRARLVVFGL